MNAGKPYRGLMGVGGYEAPFEWWLPTFFLAMKSYILPVAVGIDLPADCSIVLPHSCNLMERLWVVLT